MHALLIVRISRINRDILIANSATIAGHHKGREVQYAGLPLEDI